MTLENEKNSTLKPVVISQKREKAEKSYMGRIGKLIAPVFAPIGIDWRGSVALLTGFFAKEIVVSSLGILYATEEDESSDALQKALKASGMSPLSALALMVFVLLYDVPCIATVTAIKRETGSWKWASFNIAYSTFLAWFMALLVYQGGRLFGLA
ncbi:MAG: hypothetical protein K9L30_03175 [Desulfobacterales bacterium]|nr:hypothetical protein [Desulfobacterales bacterium]